MGYAWRASGPATLTAPAQSLLERFVPAAGQHAEPAAPAVTFALVTDRAAPSTPSKPEWNDLFSRAGRDTQPFQTFNWNWHWANHYLAARRRARAARA